MSREDPPTVVEYCANNVTCRDAIGDLDCETRVYPCLERCGRCRRTPMLVVDGEVYTAGSHEALVDRLRGGEP